MATSCAEWLRLLAAYKAGQNSNKDAIDAGQDRAKVDDGVARAGDDDVARRLRGWDRDSP